MMSSHHLELLEKCKEASHIPPGLRISLTPQTPPKWRKASTKSSPRCKCNSLLKHAQNDLDKVSATLSSSLSLLSPSQTAPPPAAHGEDQHQPGEKEETAGY